VKQDTGAFGEIDSISKLQIYGKEGVPFYRYPLGAKQRVDVI
jgi:hypothetical protein